MTKTLYEQQDWKPTYWATQSDLGSVRHPDCFFHVLTLFLDERDYVTFVALVPQGQQPPRTYVTINQAKGFFAWRATNDFGRESDWRPEFN